MQRLELTLDSPAENLALDEALLDEAEASDNPLECLRLWEPARPVVVLGRSSQLTLEVHAEDCQSAGIPILRRASGGAAIVTGPGCLMYAVILSYDARPELRSLDRAHRFVLETILDVLRPLAPGAMRQGTSDLTRGQHKFSGNSVRCKRRHFLYHGTLLYDFDLPLIERCLRMPPREPAYREKRAHQSFVINLPVARAALCAALIDAWQAHEPRAAWPRERMQQLVSSKYSQPDWNHQL